MERSADDLTRPEFFDWFTDEHVRFSDTDMAGHVNNTGHAALIETARIRYAMELAERAGLPGAGALAFVRLEIDFRAELHWPARVRVGARVVRVGTSSFTAGIGVFEQDRCITTSHNVLVHLGDAGRPAPLPDAIRELLTAELRSGP